jgi:hypothetical protein
VPGTPRTAVSRGDLGERPHRGRGSAGDTKRDGEEAEPFPRKPAEVAEVLDDEHSGAQEARPSLRGEIGSVVDVAEIDTDERCSGAHEELDGLASKIRPGPPVSGRPPVIVPSGPDDDRPILDSLLVELECERTRLSGSVENHSGDASDGGERDPVQIRSVLEAGERGVETGSRLALGVQKRRASFEDVSELDEPRH